LSITGATAREDDVDAAGDGVAAAVGTLLALAVVAVAWTDCHEASAANTLLRRSSRCIVKHTENCIKNNTCFAFEYENPLHDECKYTQHSNDTVRRAHSSDTYFRQQRYQFGFVFDHVITNDRNT
jgi:hypothetical protein